MRRSSVLFIGAMICLNASNAFSQTKSGSVPTRDQIPDQYKWNLEEIYSNKVLWEADFSKIEKEYIPQVAAFKGKLTNSGTVLKCFQISDDAGRVMEKAFVYIHLKADENQASNEISEMSSRTETLSAHLAEASAFIRPELLALPDETLKGFMENPSFVDYKHTLDALLKMKAHTLSKPEEELLAASSDMAGAPSEIYNKLRLADMTYPKIKDDHGKEIQLSPGLYARILENPDREYRKRAFEAMYSSYDHVKNTLASALLFEVKKDQFYSHARKFSSSLEASLYSEFIPRSVYDNLVQSVNNHLTNLQKYLDLRRKIMEIDKVHIYDMYVPLVKNYKMNISYEEAKKMILEGLSPLGTEYLDTLKKGFDNRWLDVYETKNKNTGGYNWGAYDTHPYILMNYNDTVDAMQTAAHEMGHAMNSYFVNHTQKYPNSGVPIFNAEVASTANEVMMLKYLIQKATNDTEKIYFINNLVEMIRGTVYTQVMYSEFEKLIHERIENGEALSAQSLNGLYLGLMKKYFGGGFESDELAPLWWSRIPHFYMDFYVYKYATSLAASYEMVKQIQTGKDQSEAKARYLDFLKAGSSDYPIEILKKAGVDMTSTVPVDNLLNEFGALVDQMEKLLIKTGRLKQSK